MQIMKLNESFNEKEYLDLKQIGASIFRSRKIIFLVTSVSIIAGLIDGFTTPKTWEGEFQIVLSRETNSSLPMDKNMQIDSFRSSILGTSSKTLKTEVSILRSPSILRPVYDYVKERRIANGEASRRFLYRDWVMESLNINLEKGTRILSITYRDSSPEEVLNVLSRISNEYKSYSTRDKDKRLSNSLDYLDNSITSYKKRSNNSSNAAERYGIENDMIIVQPNKKNYSTEDKISFSDIDSYRISLTNQIKNINYQLNQIEEIGEDADALMYISRSIPAVNAKGLPGELDNIIKTIAAKRDIFKDNDPIIEKLLNRKRILIRILKRQTKGYLTGQRIDTEARLEEVKRPKEVIIKYRDLLRAAARDQVNLNNLETMRDQLSLNKSYKDLPWKLISEPSVLPYPVAPSKKKVLLAWTLCGIFFGTFSGYILEKFSGKIYSKDTLESKLGFKELYSPIINKKEELEEYIKLLSEGELIKSNFNSISILTLSSEKDKLISTFESYLKKYIPNKKVSLTSNLIESLSSDKQVLIIEKGKTKFKEINNLKKKLKVIDKEMSGWIFIDSNIIF